MTGRARRPRRRRARPRCGCRSGRPGAGDRVAGARDDDERPWERGDVAERDEEPPRPELRALDQLRRRIGRGQHEVGGAGQLVELRHGVPGEVLGDGRGDGVELVGAELVVVVGRPVAPGQCRRVDAVLFDEARDRLHVGHPGLAATEPEGHEAVEARPDLAGDADVGPGASAAVLGPREAPDVAHGGDHHDLLGGDVDHLRPARGECGQRGHGRLRPGVAPGRGLGAAHGRPVGIAGAVHVAGRGHDPEVGRLPGGARPVEAEGGDEHPHRTGGDRRVGLDHSGPARCGQDDVCAGEEHGQGGVGRPVHHERRLSRVPRRSAQRGAVGPEWCERPQRVARRRLDAHDLGSEVGQDAAGHGRRLAGQVGDADAGEQRLAHRRLRRRRARGRGPRTPSPARSRG